MKLFPSDTLTKISAFASEPLGARDLFYLRTYRPILSHFRGLSFSETLHDKDASDVGVILTYSWMARGLLKADSLQNYSRARTVLDHAKASGEIDHRGLEMVRSYVSESMIGASKFLHFLRPDRFAIWDTRVAQAAYGRGYDYVNSIGNYLKYLECIRATRVSEEVKSILSPVLGYEVTDLRMKEFALFVIGSKSNRDK